LINLLTRSLGFVFRNVKSANKIGVEFIKS